MTLAERLAAADIAAAYRRGDIATGQRLNREVAIAKGGSVESGGALKESPAVPGRTEGRGARASLDLVRPETAAQVPASISPSEGAELLARLGASGGEVAAAPAIETASAQMSRRASLG
jgi:hypothetical protein